jgi:hypothetical protein
MRKHQYPLLICILLIALAQSAFAEDLLTAVGQGRAEVSLIGDGKSTIKTKLLFKNLTAEPLTLTMPQNTVFECEARQPVLVLQAKEITLGPKAAAQSTVHTMCLGKPSDQPATEEPTVYKPIAPEDSADGEKASRFIETCEKLKKDGQFPALPLPPALEVRIISQMAYWKDQGDLSKEEVREQAYVQMGIDPEQPSPEQEKEVDEGVDNIFQAIDLTQKASKES